MMWFTLSMATETSGTSEYHTYLVTRKAPDGSTVRTRIHSLPTSVTARTPPPDQSSAGWLAASFRNRNGALLTQQEYLDLGKREGDQE